MSSSTLTVKVHPVVFMTIVDSYERRSNKQGKTQRALGTLLGFHEKNAVQVTNCYAIPIRDVNTDTAELDDTFNREMWQVSKRAAPSEQIVGWFYTTPEIHDACLYYHTYYSSLIASMSVKKELPPVILLTMDVTFSGENKRLPLKAYIKADTPTTEKTTAAALFQSVNIELDSFPGENVALRFVTKGITSERREIRLENSLEQLEQSTTQMIEWLEQLLAYVDNVLAQPELPADPTIGRKLMEVVTHASTQLQPEKLESLVKNSLRDYMMIDYLANLTKTMLVLQEKIVAI